MCCPHRRDMLSGLEFTASTWDFHQLMRLSVGTHQIRSTQNIFLPQMLIAYAKMKLIKYRIGHCLGKNK